MHWQRLIVTTRSEEKTVKPCVRKWSVAVGTLPQIPPEKVAPHKVVNVVDPDCHVMKMKEGYCAAGYNAQVAVDTQSHLINRCVDRRQIHRQSSNSAGGPGGASKQRGCC
jgi:hypothetical protein